MSASTISIFGNKIFLEIINEIKLFSKFKIKFYDDFNLFVQESEKNNQLAIYFVQNREDNHLSEIIKNSFPFLIIFESMQKKDKLFKKIDIVLNAPFKIIDFQKKIVSLIAKNQFRINSLIYLNNYIIDKNERKIKKNHLELQLSEKEIDLLVLFSKSNKPVSKNFVLQNIWNYSSKSETHTVETHIHRLRKKILEKFGDNNFIKNDKEGYYI